MGRFARALICAVSAWLAMGRTAMADTGAGTDSGDALHSIAFFYGKTSAARRALALRRGRDRTRPRLRTAGRDRPAIEADLVCLCERRRGQSFTPVLWRDPPWLAAWHERRVAVVGRRPDCAGWPAFLVDKVVAPLWRQGYRGFFLDTLDSYQLVATTDAARSAQQAGLVAVIRAIHTRFPGAYLILNRGFELLPAVHDIVDAVAFESLFRGWNQSNRQYVEVAPQDRDWLLGQARTARDQYRLPLISIDYCDPADMTCAQDTATKIRALGIVHGSPMAVSRLWV